MANVLPMYEDMYIRLTEEEMQEMNRTSIALKDGSGYLAELGVYHQIHCVVSPKSTFLVFPCSFSIINNYNGYSGIGIDR